MTVPSDPMNGKRAKKLRRENEIVIILDVENARWLLGFFTVLTAATGDVLNSDIINSHQAMKALQKGLDEQAKNNAAE